MPLLVAILGELFRQLLQNLPALIGAVKAASVATLEDAAPAPEIEHELEQTLRAAIEAGDVPAPGKLP